MFWWIWPSAVGHRSSAVAWANGYMRLTRISIHMVSLSVFAEFAVGRRSSHGPLVMCVLTHTFPYIDIFAFGGVGRGMGYWLFVG